MNTGKRVRARLHTDTLCILRVHPCPSVFLRVPKYIALCIASNGIRGRIPDRPRPKTLI